MCVMKTIGVRELRQNLSVYLRAIQEEGEPIEVTDRGRPVAVLAPLKVGSDDYDALEAAGRLRPAQATWSTLAAPVGPVTTAGTDALAALREDRF
jgi:prevent-host-death family protein